MAKKIIESTTLTTTFTDEGDFLDKLRAVENDTEWYEVSADSIELAAVDGANPFPEMGGDPFNCVTISFNNGWTARPLRNTCLNSLLQRAEVAGTAIKKLFIADPNKFSSHLNTYLRLKDEKRKAMKALVQEGKVSAVHSAGYAVIPMPQIFEMTADYMADTLEDSSFIGGEWSWEMSTALYRVEDRRLLQAYSNLLGKYFQFKEISVSLRATSSDVAENAVRFSPRLVIDGVTIPLSADASVRHYGDDADIDMVADKLAGVFTSFSASCRVLSALADLSIQNTKNTMIKVFSKLAIPQKYAAEVVEHYDNTASNALLVYTGMCRVLNNMKAAGLEAAQLVMYEDLLAKVITFNATMWRNFDIPGTVSWNAKSN